MKPPTIFGREPVVIVNSIEAVLACLIAFHALAFIHITTLTDMAVVMAVVSSALGIYVAYVTKDTLLAAITGFIKAGVALAAIYGWNLTEQQTAAVLVVVTTLFAAWHRTQTGPALRPSLNLSQHSVDIPPEGETTENVSPVVTKAVSK